MSGILNPPPTDCPWWCVVVHAPSEGDDGGHHSHGTGLDARVRRRNGTASADAAETTRLEVGLSRAATDTLTWIVVEDGREQYLALSPETARLVVDAITGLLGTAAPFEREPIDPQ